MKKTKSSALLKADARQQLLGNYKTVIFAFLIYQFVASGCLSIVQSQINQKSLAGMIIYYATSIIITLLASVYEVGQNHMYLNLAYGNEIHLKDLTYGIHHLADKAIFATLIILIKYFLFSLPFAISVIAFIKTRNFYLAPLIALSIILMITGILFVYIRYSQTLYLILDHENLSAGELLNLSKTYMHGHYFSYFYLIVSFIGMFLLSLITFGIGLIWVYPYFISTKTNFYLSLIYDANPNEAAPSDSAIESIS